jgi:rhomboid protease GluP
VSDETPPGPLDRAVEQVAKLLNAVGLNGTRLMWKWNRRRRALAESGAQRKNLWRSARGKHKMCPACRALVGRSDRVCSECGEMLGGVSAPGLGRMAGNLLPGISSVSSVLMLVNGFWFLMMIMAQMKAGGGSGGSLFGGFDVPLLVRFGAGIKGQGTLYGVLTGGEWWRLITPVFLHGGLIHFLFNSYMLMNLGPIVQEIYGGPRCWVIYLVCGITGSMASQYPYLILPLNRPPTASIGASGAILGLIGLLLVYGYRTGGVLGQAMKNLLMRLIIFTVLLSFMGIDHLAHIGGFAGGAVLALIVPAGSYRSRGEETLWQVLSVVGVLLVLFAFYKVALFGRIVAGT